jgi:hypothetical protein
MEIDVAQWWSKLCSRSARAAESDLLRVTCFEEDWRPIVCYEVPSFRIDDAASERLPELVSASCWRWYWFSSSWAARQAGASTDKWPPDTAPEFRLCAGNTEHASSDARLWVEHEGWFIGKRVWMVGVESLPAGGPRSYREWVAGLQMFERGEAPWIHCVVQLLEDCPRMQVFADRRIPSALALAQSGLGVRTSQRFERRRYTTLRIASLKYASIWIGSGD